MFVKGQVANPTGYRGPRDDDANVVDLCRRLTPAVVYALGRIVKDSKQPASARVSAGVALLDRAWGKAPSFSTTDINDFRRATEMSDDELILIAQRGGITLDLVPVSRETKSQADYPPVTQNAKPSDTKQ